MKVELISIRDGWQFGAVNPRTNKYHWDVATKRRRWDHAERLRETAVANLLKDIAFDIDLEVARLVALREALGGEL